MFKLCMNLDDTSVENFYVFNIIINLIISTYKSYVICLLYVKNAPQARFLLTERWDFNPKVHIIVEFMLLCISRSLN